MAVLRLDLERLPDQELLDVELHGCRPTCERRRDEDLHAVVLHGLVGGQVLPLEVGVDRHLGDAASGEGRDEIERHDAAAAAGEL